MGILENFIDKVNVIKNLRPKYKSGGSGTNGTCDCVGLVIGALRRAGIKYTGIHGSNYFARKELTYLAKIDNQDELKLGEVVFQIYNPGEAGYALPGRYKKGGQYYNGDLIDYMHIGVVTSLDPFQITHMWQPTVKVENSIGRYWRYHGWIKKIPNPDQQEEKEPEHGSYAIVTAPTGKTVNMRVSPSLKARLIHQIKIGTQVQILVPGEEWAQIKWNGKTGYMMAKFLKIE